MAHGVLPAPRGESDRRHSSQQAPMTHDRPSTAGDVNAAVVTTANATTVNAEREIDSLIDNNFIRQGKGRMAQQQFHTTFSTNLLK